MIEAYKQIMEGIIMHEKKLEWKKRQQEYLQKNLKERKEREIGR